ncbi:hypothetical protein QY97_02240 [Bacillus thermotolerans]|nr:hypothetical protein QY97_02240 [Bacillus thermotolerans]
MASCFLAEFCAFQLKNSLLSSVFRLFSSYLIKTKEALCLFWGARLVKEKGLAPKSDGTIFLK